MVWREGHAKRYRAHETLYREHVHLLGARAVDGTSHNRWRATWLRTYRTTVRHTDLLVSPLHVLRSFSICCFYPVAMDSPHSSWLSRAHPCWFLNHRRPLELVSFRTARPPLKHREPFRALSSP